MDSRDPFKPLRSNWKGSAHGVGSLVNPDTFGGNPSSRMSLTLLGPRRFSKLPQAVIQTKDMTLLGKQSSSLRGAPKFQLKGVKIKLLYCTEPL